MPQKKRRRKPKPPVSRKKSLTPKFPIATIAYYGPTADIATKIVVGIFRRPGGDGPDHIKKWYADRPGDIRHTPNVTAEISEYLKQFRVKETTMTDRIIGCPHEEGIDYPEGASCPQCPYWENRNRWTGKLYESDE